MDSSTVDRLVSRFVYCSCLSILAMNGPTYMKPVESSETEVILLEMMSSAARLLSSSEQQSPRTGSYSQLRLMNE